MHRAYLLMRVGPRERALLGRHHAPAWTAPPPGTLPAVCGTPAAPIVRMQLRGGPAGSQGGRRSAKALPLTAAASVPPVRPVCSKMSEGQGRLSVGVDAILSNTTMPLNKTKVSSSGGSRKGAVRGDALAAPQGIAAGTAVAGRQWQGACRHGCRH